MKHEILVTWELPGKNPYELLIYEVISCGLSAEKVTLPCEINICLTDDEGIREINLDMRKLDAPTDVLSFPMFPLTPGVPPVGEDYLDPETELCPLGDMMISVPRVLAQAQEYGHSPRRELAYLLIHSLLHLLGYDHLDEGVEKARMRRREEEILSLLHLERAAETTAEKGV